MYDICINMLLSAEQSFISVLIIQKKGMHIEEVATGAGCESVSILNKKNISVHVYLAPKFCFLILFKVFVLFLPCMI